MEERNEMKSISCLLCGQDNYSVVSRAQLDGAEKSYNYLTEYPCHYRIVKCSGCGMVYSNPIFNEDKILSLYRNSSIDKCIDKTFTSIQMNMRRYFDRLLRYSGIEKGHLLDVGCGIGHLLKYAQSKGFTVSGVEPNINAVEYSRAILSSDTIKTGAYTRESYSPETFDLITIIHVIDHVISPKKLLQTAQYHLKRGGYILVATHNIASLLGLIMGKKFIAYHVQHIGYFTPDLLCKMMNKCGLAPVKTLQSITTYPISHYIENGVRGAQLRERLIKCLRTLRLDALRLTLPMGNMEIISKKS